MVSPGSMTSDSDAPPRLPAAAEPLGGSRREERIALALSAAQVRQVMRAAAGTPPGFEAPDDERTIGIDEPLYRDLMSDRRLSRSLLSGLVILHCFHEVEELGIADISRRLDMRTSTTHRYVSTLLAAGLLERDPVSRLYRLAQA